MSDYAIMSAMNQLMEMSRKVTSSLYFDAMQRFAAPLRDLGVNHFWYYEITNSGYYSFLGTHTAWNDFCFEEPSLLSDFTCLRHPSLLKKGINLMKADPNPAQQKVLELAWNKFQINFNINLISLTTSGIEAFGFATCYLDPHADERLLNELPLLRHFIKLFREKHKNLFQILQENRVDLARELGPRFYQAAESLSLPSNRQKLLSKMGLEEVLQLTPRELEVLKFLPYGFPARYIADQLGICVRTAENYIASIKSKFACSTKVELIHKAQDIAATGYLYD